jgi:uncharacterized Zn finger protein
MTQYLITATCNICHSDEIEMIQNDKNGPMLYCGACGFARIAEVSDLFQDYLICA